MFFSEAIAQTAAAPAAAGNNLMSLIPFLGIIVFMYFFVMRPQMKKQKALQNMLANVKAGDEVLTIGGIIGTVSAVESEYIHLKLSATTEIKCQKNAIQSILPTGTQKNI